MKTIRQKFQVNGNSLLIRAAIRFALSMAIICLFLFVSAGTILFFNAWLYLATLFTPMVFTLAYLIRKNPDLLEKRLRTGERDKAQKRNILLSLIFITASFIIPGLDFRFNWSEVPLWLVILSTVVMFSGYMLFVCVIRVNSYASRIIEIQDGQRVIDTGPYFIIRHPMYLAVLLMYIATPLVLGSYYALIPMISLPFILISRINSEEKVLSEGLEGYSEYMDRVKYRFIPFIW